MDADKVGVPSGVPERLEVNNLNWRRPVVAMTLFIS